MIRLQYEALSYVWGDRADGTVIRVAGREVEVTSNLYAALQRLRNPHSNRALWIDQLCINQWDSDEKTEQVNMMRLIYKNCSRCMIWLGEIIEQDAGFSIRDAENAFSFICVFAAASKFPDVIIPPTMSAPEAFEGARNAFKGLILNGYPWWSRIWTVQEAVLPPKAIVMWGPLTIAWETLELAAFNMCMNRIPRELLPALHQFCDDYDQFTGPVRGLDIARSGEPALDLLQRWRYREATDPRDKFYALMGLFQTMPFARVQSCSYELSPAILYTRVTLDLIHLEGGLRPLVGRRGEPHMTAGLPTWVLDLVRCTDSKKRAWKWWNHSHRYKVFNADGNESFKWESISDGSVLALTGVFVSKVVEKGEVVTEETWKDLSDDQLIDTLLEWEEMLAQFILRHETYAWGPSWGNAFWRTMIGDLIMGEFPIRRAVNSDYHKFMDFGKNGTRNDIWYSLRDMVVNQAFFIAEGGYIGIGPPTTQVGDEIWVLFGGKVPFVLRPRANQTTEHAGEGSNVYYLVGDAFVHGIMDGGAVKDHGREREAILLY